MKTVRRKFLATATAALVFIGVIGASTPFILSLSPPRFPTEVAVELDVSDLGAFSSKIVHLTRSMKEERGMSTRWIPGEALIVLQQQVGRFRVFHVPTWEGAVMMPGRYWGQHEGYCEDFLADIGLQHEYKLRCEPKDGWHDAYRSENWFWSFDGKNISGDLPDLQVVAHEQAYGRMYVAMHRR